MAPANVRTMRRSRSRTGFSLIEAITALAVASIALLGLLRLHLLSVASAEKAEALTTAVLLAQERLTEAACAAYPRTGVEAGRTETDRGEMTWRTEISSVRSAHADLRRGGLYEVAVEVGWGPADRQKRIEMMTYVAESRIHAK